MVHIKNDNIEIMIWWKLKQELFDSLYFRRQTGLEQSK